MRFGIGGLAVLLSLYIARRRTADELAVNCSSKKAKNEEQLNAAGIGVSKD